MEHSDLERVKNVHLEANINNQILFIIVYNGLIFGVRL
jgi:hypothetical protein